MGIGFSLWQDLVSIMPLVCSTKKHNPYHALPFSLAHHITGYFHICKHALQKCSTTRSAGEKLSERSCLLFHNNQGSSNLQFVASITRNMYIYMSMYSSPSLKFLIHPGRNEHRIISVECLLQLLLPFHCAQETFDAGFAWVDD